MILQYNIEYIIFKYKSQSVDYNKIETSGIWQLTVLTYNHHVQILEYIGTVLSHIEDTLFEH